MGYNSRRSAQTATPDRRTAILPAIASPRAVRKFAPLALFVALFSFGVTGLSFRPAGAGVGVWTGTGPRAKSIKGIARDPLHASRMWAASFGAGVYRSVDGGMIWTAQRKGLGNTFVRCVTPQPNHPDSVFCGTNDGIFLSVDGGVNWNQILATTVSVRAIAIHPIRTGVIYAATYGNGVLKSLNGGLSWSTVNLGLGNTLVRDVAYHPTKPETLLAATGTGSIDPPGPGGLFRSINGGLTWSQLADTTGSNNGSHGAAGQIQFDRLDPQRIYVAELDRGVLKSIDGGTTWTRANLGLKSFRTRSLAVVDTLRYVGTVATDTSGIFFTTLNDPRWHLVKNNVTVEALFSSAVSPGTAWAGTDGEGIFRTDDRGANWIQLDGGLLSTISFSLAVRPATHAVYDGTGFGDQFWRSTDQGVTWTRARYLFSHNSEHGVAVDPVLPSRVYLSAYGSGVYRSDDDGITWYNPDSLGRTLANVFVRDLVAGPGTSERLFVGTGIGPFETTDGGNGWTSRVGDLPPNFSVHAMALIPGTPFTMFVGNDSLGVYKTVDGGNTWVAKNNGLPGPFVHALLVDATNPAVVYASLDTLNCAGCYGVFKSANGGDNWAPARTGLPVAEVRALAQDPVNPGVLFCGVYGGGVFESQDAGASWQPVANQNGLSSLRVRALAVDGALRTIYAGTENGVAALTNYQVQVTGVGPEPALAPALSTWPTPVGGGRLNVSFALTRPGSVAVEVYDVRGARVRTLTRSANETAGTHTLAWDRRDDHGDEAAAGLYFLRLATGEGSRTVRVVLLGR